MKAKEKTYIAHQKDLMRSVQKMQEQLEHQNKANQELKRDLQYSNRQVEDLKAELINSEMKSQSHHSYHTYQY